MVYCSCPVVQSLLGWLCPMTPLMRCATDWHRFPPTWCDMMTLRRPTILSRPMNCRRSAVVKYYYFDYTKGVIKALFCLELSCFPWWCLTFLFQAVNQANLARALVPPQLTLKDFFMTGRTLVHWCCSLHVSTFFHATSPQLLGESQYESNVVQK